MTSELLFSQSRALSFAIIIKQVGADTSVSSCELTLPMPLPARAGLQCVCVHVTKRAPSLVDNFVLIWEECKFFDTILWYGQKQKKKRSLLDNVKVWLSYIFDGKNLNQCEEI